MKKYLFVLLFFLMQCPGSTDPNSEWDGIWRVDIYERDMLYNTEDIEMKTDGNVLKIGSSKYYGMFGNHSFTGEYRAGIYYCIIRLYLNGSSNFTGTSTASSLDNSGWYRIEQWEGKRK